MKVEVKIPFMSSNSDEATFNCWLKKEGERVQEGDPIAELETDKVNFELEAPASGVLIDIRVGENEVIKFGTVVAYIETD